MHPHSWRDKPQETQNPSKSAKHEHQSRLTWWGFLPCLRFFWKPPALFMVPSAHWSRLPSYRESLLYSTLQYVSLIYSTLPEPISKHCWAWITVDVMDAMNYHSGRDEGPCHLWFFLFKPVSHSVSFYWWIELKVITANDLLLPKILFNDSGRLCY